MKLVSPDYFRYQGRSMWPCFQEGDLLEIEPVAFAQIKRGDCIAYRQRNSGQTVHRVVATGAALTTRGDAMSGPDKAPIASEQVIGLVVRRFRFGQETTVGRGLPGRVTGRVLHYAGRLDPGREARGGRLARVLRRHAMQILRRFKRTGTMERLTRHNEPDLVVWKMGEQIVGRQDPASGNWQISWPWNVFLDIRERL